MEPIYIDIHIHTSEDPDNLNQQYDVETLFANITRYANESTCLISLTDHNTINKKAYLDALQLGNPQIKLILGAEIHIKNYNDAPAYHCHILFKSEIAGQAIDKINKILDELYPHKQVVLTDPNIPCIEDIARMFDEYEFLLLPHGGQSHATFDKSIPQGVIFDTTIERSIYYNQFEGYTARAKEGLETTIEYFKRLGINEFVNLVTCTDNYNPDIYPSTKASDASPHVPTWMYAEPSFDGLRLSLSESSRLFYSNQKPSAWSEYIRGAYLANNNINIDVTFSPGLNVIIGGSSSGKTLLVDSIYRKISDCSFNDSHYNNYDVSDIEVVNNPGFKPNYISQNYIMMVVNNDTSRKIEDLDIIKRIFPVDLDFQHRIESTMASFRTDVSDLIRCAEQIEMVEQQLSGMPHLGRLIVLNKTTRNTLKSIEPREDERAKLAYSQSSYYKHKSSLDDILGLIERNPFLSIDADIINEIKEKLSNLYKISLIEERVYDTITSKIRQYDEVLRSSNEADQAKSQQQERLLTSIKDYVRLHRRFNQLREKILQYDFNEDSKTVESMGHHLYVQNKFSLSENKIRNTFNTFLSHKIDSFERLSPQDIFKSQYTSHPRIEGYEGFINKVCGKLSDENRTTYKIKTKDGIDFDSLSAGWKTSILLDLILGYAEDLAPIIIDQPEDNLATTYINDGLISAIKHIKKTKQVILVSHNATTPMLADAQTIIYCENKGGKIDINSAPLEGNIRNIPVLDIIAKITDGGKPSIKKRVKKYNLKKYR